MTQQEGGYVRWREMIPILITIFSMAVAIAMGALYIHGQAPHKDAVPRKEFERFTHNVENNFNRVLDKLDKIAK